MTFITEQELREQWQEGRVTRFEFPAGTRFSPSARDFINQWRLQVFVGGERATEETPRVAHYSEGGLPYLAHKWKNVQERS
jgi:ethanolamine utilization cobalamin adenosyltransferase